MQGIKKCGREKYFREFIYPRLSTGLQESAHIHHQICDGTGNGRGREGPCRGTARHSRVLLIFIALAALLFTLPAPVIAAADLSAAHNSTGPQRVDIGVYVVDLNNFNIGDGSFGVNFYLTLDSDTPVSLTDLEIMNGWVTSVETLLDTPTNKSYRIFASITANPDLRLYPFDRHTLPFEFEPKLDDESRVIFVIHKNSTGHEPDVGIPGWQFLGDSARVLSRSYDGDPLPYSRAIFTYDFRRDVTSNLLKFFLPILLLIIVTLSSLLMKGPSRLGLNASMFIVAVFIHWRISDSIPLVAYATFLDEFMIITYITIVLVLVSGILIQKFTESGDTHSADRISTWSLWIVPPLSIGLYVLLFASLLVSG